MTARNKLMASLFRWLEAKIDNSSYTPVSTLKQKVVRQAAEVTFNLCYNLPSSADRSNKQEDVSEDEDGWLPLSLSLRACHYSNERDPALLLMFYATLCNYTIKKESNFFWENRTSMGQDPY